MKLRLSLVVAVADVVCVHIFIWLSAWLFLATFCRARVYFSAQPVGRQREREREVGGGGSSSELGIWAYINFRHVKFVMLYFFVKQLPTHKYSSNYRCVCV